MSKHFFFILTLVFGIPTAGLAQVPDGLEFKKVKKGKDLAIRSCKLIKGFSKATIVSNGATVELNGRKPYKLGSKFKFFACANDGASTTDSLYAKSSKEGEVTTFTFTKSDFPKQADPLKKHCKSISGVTYLLKPASPGHIHDSRESGFALICAPGKKCPRFPAAVRYSDGDQAASLCYYGRWSGNGQSRAYCAVGSCGSCDARAIARASSTKRRDGRIYIEYGDGTCARADADARNGSPF